MKTQDVGGVLMIHAPPPVRSMMVEALLDLGLRGKPTHALAKSGSLG